jgi:2-(1,2-epoxy-1,2-dihydrophenyl)acetyl-CoA isomerase
METLVVERSGGVVTVTMNRPEKKNAIDATMWNELLATFREVRDNAEDRVLVLTGAGGAFCSGADLTDLTAAGANHQLVNMRHYGDIGLALHRLPKPAIAKVTGVAAGAGWGLALGCDLVVASEGARFSMIFSRRGLSLDLGGSWLLPRMIGLHRAKEVALFADILSAQQAHDLGLVNRLLPAGEVDAFVDDWAARLAAGPPLALSLTKTMLNNAMQVSMDQALEDEARSQTVNFHTEDAREAMGAFIEKRDPEFRGR